ncbi:MAG: type II toxin-antitoxin system RelE/ParE family toxin [Clostridia bacterium]|nr:type II toxin-antitoxin system RelE/ParE family toxin [Clostridia bacterium]
MDKYIVKITPQAHSDMLEIFRYVSNVLKERSTAAKLLDKIETSINSLDIMPHRIPLVKEEPWRSQGIHIMPIQNFLIYFWINENLKEVHIIAVIYGKRDQFELLKQIDI